MNRSALVLLLLIGVSGLASTSASEDDHHHDDHHDHEACACRGRELGVGISCTSLNMLSVNAAIAYLEDPANKCNQTEACPGHYFLLQSHHDFCPHDVLPAAAEKALHDFEDYYEDCEIARQYDSKLTNCPQVDCHDRKAFTDAADVLANNQCNVTCNSNICKGAIRTVLMAHDTCDEDDVPESVEKALHDYEEACEDYLCNSRTKVYDPRTEVCPGDSNNPYVVHDDGDNVKMDVLVGVVCGIGVVVLALAGFVAFLAKREKAGRPVWKPLV